MKEYEKVRKLGRGNQGQVWLVENKHTGQYAAMKIYPKGKEESAKRELGILRRFGGKGVPYLLDYQEDGQYIYLIMEYVEGSSLRVLMNKQRVWSEKDCIDIVNKIANVLAVFHSQSPALIYGDLKPENIMVRQDRTVALIDFGSVVEIGERNRKVYGTKAYLPPDEDGVSPYRDTYALGTIMYELLTGQMLSQGIGNGKADIRHLSSGCQRIMKKAVRIRKESGYADAGKMYEELMVCKKAIKEEFTMKKMWKSMGKIRKKKNFYI
ncbi:MAG: serine/threonine-protein kinase [Lachnospiraceae bacterium]|nr:serine/threonine-protein kinase [Lachnospiraceae bacterium]